MLSIKENLVRDSRFELLRAIAMFLILFGHVKSHYMGEIYTHNIYMSLMMPILSVHVNLFILISGYFGINLKLKSIYSLWSIVLFYTGLNVIANFLLDVNLISIKTSILYIIFPFSEGDYWFIRIYVLLMLVSPLINYILDNIKTDKQWYKVLFIVLLVNVYFSFFHHVSSLYAEGFDLINFICLYIIGRFLGYKKFNVRKYRMFFIVLVIMFLKLFLLGIGYYFPYLKESINLNCYSNPINIVYAVAVYLLFSSFKIQNKFINYIASSALAAYLLTSHIVGVKIFSNIFNKYFQYIESYNQIFVFLILIVFTIILFFSSILIDKCRIFLFKPLDRFVLNKIEQSKFKGIFKI